MSCCRRIYYYPFGMEMEGLWELSVSSPENKYLYNGKERDSDFGLNWDHFGFRMYDSAIARFVSVDPLAEDYSFQTPYAYAANNPILFMDYLGLGPIYGPDGQLIGWTVEDGEGATQIAQKLNESYGCEMTCDVNYVDIVQDNPESFPNGFNEDGSVKDKSSEDFKSGNLEPGMELKIDGGKDMALEKDLKTLDRLKGKEEYKTKEVQAHENEKTLRKKISKSGYTGGEDGRVMELANDMNMRNNLDAQHGHAIDDLNKIKDSIKIINKSISERENK